VPGLQEAVEILRDRWGISHIYAKNQHDLFFAQGYNAARDRLFQLEIWRRRATGTIAEIQGAKALDRDIGARLQTDEFSIPARTLVPLLRGVRADKADVQAALEADAGVAAAGIILFAQCEGGKSHARC
jgi:acyl-homoserine lactone acylase PvdQ